MSTGVSVLLALLMLGIMVAAHETGHFVAARACGIAVRAFGIGFGPKLLGWTGKSGTEYVLRLIPGGGYCAFYGEDDVKGETAKTDPRAITLQKPWKRLITLIAGPFMNFVLAFAAAMIFYAGYGVPYAGDRVETRVVSVTPGSPADAAGFQTDDVILSVEGREITDNFSREISGWDGGEPLHITLLRDGEQVETRVTPDYIGTEGRYMIGVNLTVGAETVWRHESFGETAAHAFDVCVSAGGAILNALRNMITRGEGIDQMSGPVGVIRVIAQQTQAYKLMGYLNMLIMISINLGLVNLLPIPGLDGGRIVFVLYEIIFRRPVNRRVESYVHLAGYVLLLGLLLFFTFHDVTNIFR